MRKRKEDILPIYKAIANYVKRNGTVMFSQICKYLASQPQSSPIYVNTYTKAGYAKVDSVVDNCRIGGLIPIDSVYY